MSPGTPIQANTVTAMRPLAKDNTASWCTTDSKMLEQLLTIRLKKVEAELNSKIESKIELAVSERVEVIRGDIIRYMQEYQERRFGAMLEREQEEREPQHMDITFAAGAASTATLGFSRPLRHQQSPRSRLAAVPEDEDHSGGEDRRHIQEVCREEVLHAVAPLHTQAAECMAQLAVLQAALKTTQKEAVDSEEAESLVREKVSLLATKADENSIRLTNLEGVCNSLRREHLAEREFRDAMYKELASVRQDRAERGSSLSQSQEVLRTSPLLAAGRRQPSSQAAPRSPPPMHHSPEPKPSDLKLQQLMREPRASSQSRSNNGADTPRSSLGKSKLLDFDRLRGSKDNGEQASTGGTGEPPTDLLTESTASAGSLAGASSTAGSSVRLFPASSEANDLLASLRQCQAKSRALAERYRQ